MSKPSLRKNFLFNLSYQILIVLVPLVTAPYLSRVLGPAASGLYSYTQGIANYFAMAAVLGMSTYGVRLIAQCGDNRSMRSHAFCSAFTSQLIVGGLVLAAYAIYLAIAPQGGLLVALMWLMWPLGMVIDVSWLLFGCEEYKTPTIRSFITRLTTLVIIFGFVHTPDDLWIYIAAIAGTYLANALLIWPFVHRYIDFVRPTWFEVRAHFRPNLGLFIPVIAVSFYTIIDRVFLGLMASYEQGGFFQYSEQISKVPLHMITALGTVMLPRMSGVFAAGEREKGLALLESSVWFMLVCAFALGFGIVSITPEFVPVFLGEQYIPAIPVMAIMAGIIPLISFSNVLGRQYLLPLGRDKAFTLSLCAGAVINIVLCLIFIPSFGALGAGISMVCAEASVLAVQSWMVHQELPLMHYMKAAAPFFIIGIVMIAAVRLTGFFAVMFLGQGVVPLLIEIIVGGAVYAVLAFVWCVQTNNVQFHKLLDRYLKGPLARFKTI